MFLNSLTKLVAQLLNKLLIQQTKSQTKHTNDNSLIESKNSSIIRKYIGYQYIFKRYTSKINQFYQEYLNIYLNYHRFVDLLQQRLTEKAKRKNIRLKNLMLSIKNKVTINLSI